MVLDQQETSPEDKFSDGVLDSDINGVFRKYLLG
jgi:hypothetical protein